MMASIKLNQHVFCIWSSQKINSPNADFPLKTKVTLYKPLLGLDRVCLAWVIVENPPIHGLHFQVSTIMFTSSAFMPVQRGGGIPGVPGEPERFLGKL